MPKKEKIKTATRARMTDWLVRGPAKFAATLLGLSVLVGLIYAIVAQIIAPNADPVGGAVSMMLIMVIPGAYCMYRMIKKLPGTTLDRESYVGLINAVTATLAIMLGVYIILIATILMPLMMGGRPTTTAAAIFVMFGLILMALVTLYITGLTITNLYAIYLRARHLGVSRWKAIFSLPFSLFWIAGYVIDDAKKNEPVIEFRSNWYERMTHAIVTRPGLTWLCVGLLLGASSFFFGASYLPVTLALVVIFAGWTAVAGVSRTRKNIGGRFATVAVVINILILITIAAIPRGGQEYTQMPPVAQTVTQE